MRARSFFRFFAAGCIAFASVAVHAESATLYERIGGTQGLTAIVDDYVTALSTDSRTKRAFERTDPRRIKRVLTEQLCELTGGPCRYTGDSLRDIHAGLHIDHGEFLSGLELLRDVLIDRRVPIRERNELLALLAPMQRDVVQP